MGDPEEFLGLLISFSCLTDWPDVSHLCVVCQIISYVSCLLRNLVFQYSCTFCFLVSLEPRTSVPGFLFCFWDFLVSLESVFSGLFLPVYKIKDNVWLNPPAWVFPPLRVLITSWAILSLFSPEDMASNKLKCEMTTHPSEELGPREVNSTSGCCWCLAFSLYASLNLDLSM